MRDALAPAVHDGEGSRHGLPRTIAMANRTGADVARVRGYDRQTLIEAHVRNRIYDQHYWKESCFGVDGTFGLTCLT